MTLTDEQCEKLKQWAEVTPTELGQTLVPKLEEAFQTEAVIKGMADVVFQAMLPALQESDREWQQALGMAVEPIIKKLKQQEQRIEKLEAALFRRTLG